MLTVPLKLQVNTDDRKYRVTLNGFFSARLIMTEPEWKVRIWILFIRITMKLKNVYHKSFEERQEKRNMKVKRKNPHLYARFLIRVLKCLRIDKFRADLDTGDFPLNAQLIPVSSVLRHYNIRLNINFEDHNSIDCNIYTRLYKLLWQAIRTYIINKN